MAYRYGDANENGNENFYTSSRHNSAFGADLQPNLQRRSTKFCTTGPTMPQHGFVFKPFTRESLANIRKRRESRASGSINAANKNQQQQTNALNNDPAKPKPQPDPYLASGMQLPPAFMRQLPPELIGKPIEDIDPYYENQETFVIISRGKELTRFSATKALYLFGPFHPIRRIVLYILVNPLFSLLVISTILTNCILMTIQGSETVEKTEIIFTIVYTTEMGLKVLARGFIVDEFTYLRDPWNLLDFTVIIMAYLTIVIEDLGNLSVMRTFRVLRALKTVAIIPGMKTIVGAVIDSVKNLKDVVVLTLFSLSVFSLLGLQIYMGILTQKCILNGPSNMTDEEWFTWNSNSSNWIPDLKSEVFGNYRLCGNATGAQGCPQTHTCLQGFGPNPDHGYTNFDTFGWSLICSFRLMTQDYWEGLYMQVLKTAGSWHIFFFIVSIFLGSIYLMNLILAIVAMSYNELQRRAEQEEEAAAEDEAAFLESCKIMEEQMSEFSMSAHGAGSSYRPSVEIGLVGQSLLASLCQNGLLGQHVQEKLSKQMVLPGMDNMAVAQGFQVPGARSHSFSADRTTLAPELNPNSGHDGRLANRYHTGKRTSMQPTASSYQCDNPVETATSMTELRRKSSSMRGAHSNRSNSPTQVVSVPSRRQSSQTHTRHRGTMTPPSHGDRSTLAPSGFRISSSGRRSTRSSTTSDRDLVILRQRAALIRIGDNLVKDPESVLSSDSSGDKNSNNQRGSLAQNDFSGGQSFQLTSKTGGLRRKSENNQLSVNAKLCMKPQDTSTSTNQQDAYYDRIVQFRSEDAICQQPVSINMFSVAPAPLDVTKRQSQVKATSQLDLTSEAKLEANRSSKSQPGSPGQKQKQKQQLEVGVEAIELSGARMHHLSVENFQQFGAITSNRAAGTKHQLLVAADNRRSSTGATIHQQQQIAPAVDLVVAPSDCQISRVHTDQRGHIHPSTMARHSIARGQHQRPSVYLGATHAPGPTSNNSFRRLSQDFARRTSDWQRLSMSTNVDMRRLLRLWAHTNPYQTRTSIGSFSNASQMHYQSPSGSPARSTRGDDDRSAYGSRANSPRPSSLGSSRQAYELISAFSRRHNLYPTDQRYAIPIDGSVMMDDMSVNLRDKCLAYCLSCLDVLCIWECCGLWLKVQKIIALVVFDPFTELFIILCILINTLFMALDSDDADDHMRRIFERGNYFFTATFAVEASMKIMALSPKFYFREGWNVFDTIIVCLSLLELGLEGVYGLSVLRSFRLLRVFKLAKSWPTLNLLISIMGKAVGDLGNLTFVLAIIVFILAVMGMQLFGSKYVAHNFPDGELPRWNFTDFLHSFMIVFRILCAEWIEPMWDCLLVGGWPCIPFFLIAVTVGNLVVLNLFLALLLASFGASNLSAPQADNVDTKKLQEAIARFGRFGRWLRKKLGRFCRWLLNCILCRLGLSSGGLEAAMAGEGNASKKASGTAKCKKVKSHIASMSRLERLKNIEMRTEELKSKIRKSPERHYHLRQLAKMQLQEGQAQPTTVVEMSGAGSGFNYNYKQRHYSFKSDQTNQAEPVALIPIIVNEAPDRGDSAESSTAEQNSGSDKQVVVPQISTDTCEEVAPRQQQQQQQQQQPEWSEQRFANWQHPSSMQPIKEDSRDADSSASLSELETSLASKKSKFHDCAADVALSEHLLRPHNQQVHESVESGDGRYEDDEEDEEEEAPKSSLYLKAPKKEDMEEDDELALQYIETYLEKCICIGIICLKWFLFRRYVRKIVEHKYFDQCILVLIVVSSGTLALEDKHLKERPNLKRILDILDTIFTIIFSLEMIFKWLAFGMKRYFSNIWSWLDFLIVLVSFINLMASVLGSGKIQALKTMRTLRAMRGLRPLRALQRFQGMRVVVNALIQAIPSIFNVLLVCLIFWLIFSIMGVQMFGGKFWRCTHPETMELVALEVASNKFECIERNLTWSNPQINFDNVLNAYLALFQVATFKGWIDIMNSAADSRGRDEQPVRETNIFMYFYFVLFVIFGSFFTLNLFIGVIIDNFNEQKKKTGGSLELFMTDDQKKYYHAMKKMRSKKPIKAMKRPRMSLQAYMFDLTTSKGFDMAIMLIIGANMFVMSLEHYGQTQEYTVILENLNLIFIAIFTLECLCKIFAMRHFYFREPWNIFDFIVVVLSNLGVVMKEYVAKYFVSPTLLRVVRVVKVGRVLRLVKGAKGIRTLLFALAMSLPALFNICLLLFLVMFIYAIFGMQFFQNVRPRAGIDEIFNFGTFTSSIIVLFQMSTSAAWDQVLDPLMDEENDCQKPDPALGIEGTCGNRTISILFLVTYVIITFLIIINMYIAVILENYSQATEDVQEGLTDDDYEMYYEVWQKYDPDGTQLLPYKYLSDFVASLEEPLRLPKPNELALVAMDIPIYKGDLCYCVDILDALTKLFFTRRGLVIQVNEQLQQVQSALHATPFERITTTYMIKRENYCAKIIQNCWRKWRDRIQERKQNSAN